MASINGTNVAAMIAPFDTADTFPTHDAKYGKGGYRTVSDLTDLSEIPSQRLTEGCVAYVVSEKADYRYSSSGWIPVEKVYTETEWDAIEDQEAECAKYNNIYIVEG